MAGIDSYVELLVRGGGANGTQSFLDLSPDYRTITTVGSYVSYSTAYTKFQSSSIAFSCYGYNYAYAANHADLAMGSGNFTVDFWIYPLSFSNSFDVCNKYWKIGILTSGKPYFNDNGIGLSLTATNALSLNTWSHVALVRNGTTFTIYINGVANGSVTSAASLTATSNTFKIGPNYNWYSNWVCAIDEFRLSRGIARWTADFTPPTAAYTGSEYTMTAAGGAVGGGAAVVESTLTVIATGGAVGGGDAYEHYSVERLVATGGAVAGGSGVVRVPFLTSIPTGGVLAGGSATVVTTLVVSPTGGAVTAGSADYYVKLIAHPVRHYKAESIASSISPDSIPGGSGLQCNNGSIVAGKFGNAISVFSGSYAAYLLPYVGNYTFGSFSLWIQRKNLINLAGIACNYTGSRIIYIAADHEIKLKNSGVDTATGADITDTGWHHICVAKGSTAAKLKLFVDGVKIGTEFDADWSDGIFSFDGFTLGQNCNIDNVQVYDRILTDEEAVYLFYQDSEELPFPMEFDGAGGAIAGGDAAWSFGPYAFAFFADGGAVAGGSADVRLVGLSGPTNHWTFENTTGSITPSTAEDGVDLYHYGRTLVAGKFGNGLSAGIVTNPTGPSAPIGFKSISMWIKREMSTSQCVILSESTGERNIYADFYMSRIGVYNGTEYLFSSLTLPNDDEWHHIVITQGRSVDYLWIYVDGMKASIDLSSVGFVFFDRLTFHIGETYNRCCFQDNIQVYDRVLPQEDVTYLFNADSDDVVLPRLPAIDYGEMAGGGISGGVADILARSVSFVHVATGGGVAGSADADEIDIEGSFELLGDIPIGVTTAISIDGGFPEFYGSIDTGWNVVGRFPEFYGDIETVHTVEANIEGVFPKFYGECGIEVTTNALVIGSLPVFYGDSSMVSGPGCDIEGRFPDFYGDIDAHGRFNQIDGGFPPFFGDIDAELAANSWDLSFPDRVHEDSGTAAPEYTGFVLQFGRGRFHQIAGQFPLFYGDIGVE